MNTHSFPARRPRSSRPSRWYSLAGALLLAVIGCGDDARAPVEPGPFPPEAGASAATALSFRQVSVGTLHTCGITTDDRAYCWGANTWGQLGDGTATGAEVCATPDGYTYECTTRPVAVVGGTGFHSISAGGEHTCALTSEGRAYCWGRNLGSLGDGTTTQRLAPVAVLGGLRFRQVSAGGYHTCGVTPDDRAYCWGPNDRGQVGDLTIIQRLEPVAVVGGRRFRQVGTGNLHSCGVTTADRVFCWGDNEFGQLGIGDDGINRALLPVRVPGHAFRMADAGGNHTCAVTLGSRALCWGNGREGQIGDGNTYLRFSPRAVAGGLSFSRVASGYLHTCGLTTGHRAYCWGSNTSSQLGDGTTARRRLTPVAVAGDRYFRDIEAGERHTCARTGRDAGYCWGDNHSGQLGDGTNIDRSRPTPVAGAM